jgi:dolichol-phosphate mannosyltransferase
MSGLFAVDAQLLYAAVHRFRPTGFKILLEILARCEIDDVAELGYEFESADSESNLGPAEYINYLRHLARLSVPGRLEPRTAESTITDS